MFFVIVKHNWKIWCGFLIVDGLVFDKIRQGVTVKTFVATTIKRVTLFDFTDTVTHDAQSSILYICLLSTYYPCVIIKL